MKMFKKDKSFELENRESIMIIYYALMGIIMLIILVMIGRMLCKCIFNSEKYVIEKSNIDYKVYLKKNEYYEEKYLEKDNQYIASIIDYINADFDYKLDALGKKNDDSYSYKILAEVNVLEKNTNKSIYKFEEDLVSGVDKQFNDNSVLEIKEDVKIDYKKYNDLINKFVGSYKLDNQVSSITVSMYVDSKDLNDMGNKPVMSLNIPLTTKTIAIDIASNEVNGKRDITSQKNNSQDKTIYFIFIGFVIEGLMVFSLIRFMNNTKDEKAFYKSKVKRILLNYGSFIQKIEKDFDFDGYQSIELKAFENLLQIRDILGQPILMLEREDEAFFMVPTQSKLVYIFEMNEGMIKKRIAKHAESIWGE